MISKEGFRLLSQKDSGWYGKGMYFTQLPNYGEFYINNCLSEHGESFSLVLSWILMGRPYPVTAKMDGMGLVPGYDSHFCLVNGFSPCLDGEEASGDEIVIFRSAQVLPRYVGTRCDLTDHYTLSSKLHALAICVPHIASASLLFLTWILLC